jgi:hypothetical protein
VTHMRHKRSAAPAERHRSRDTGDETGVAPGRGAATGTPRWVSVLGIVIAVGLVLLFFVLHLTGVLGPGAH